MNEDATDRGLFPATPEIDAPKGDGRRNSTGKVVARTSLTLSKNEGKPLPHYLRASTSCCYDFCKYGRKHAFESEGMQPIFAKSSGNNTTSHELKQVNSFNLSETIKQKAQYVKRATGSTKPKIKEKVVSLVKTAMASVTPQVKQTAPLAKKSDASTKPAFSGNPKAVAVKLVSPNLSTGVSGRKRKESKVIKSVGLSKVGEKKVFRPPTSSLSPQSPANRISNLKLRKYSSLKYASSLKNQNKSGKGEPENEKLKVKSLYITESEVQKNGTPQSAQLKAGKFQSSSSSQSSSSTSSPPSSSPSMSNHGEGEYVGSDSTVSEASDSEYGDEGTEWAERNFPKVKTIRDMEELQ